MARSVPYLPAARMTFRLFGALFLGVCATTSWAQRPREQEKKFTAPDGTFAFRYPNLLIQCELKKQGSGDGYFWTPPENCAAYHPVCDGDTGEDSTAIACFAYPRNRYTDSAAFEAATFSVETVDRVLTKKGCLSGPADQIFVPRSPVTIHGVSFAVFDFGEGGMSQSVGGSIYRTFHQGKCYQMGINVATASAQAFDPPAREITKRDWHKINGRLEQARDSFRFLK